MSTYSAKLVALNRRALLLVPTTKASLVDKLGQLLLHHLIDLGDSFIQAFLCRASYMEIKRRVLWTVVSHENRVPSFEKLTEGVAMFLSG